MPDAEESQPQSAPVASALVRRGLQGAVMPIGGTEEKERPAGEKVLAGFVELAGGKGARIAVVSTASETIRHQKLCAMRRAPCVSCHLSLSSS
jgi:cyanophycinase-like exopeptidase